MEIFTSKTVRINGNDIEIQLPNECPHCSNIMIPELIRTSDLYKNTDDDFVFAILVRCIYCKKFYALSYEYYGYSGYLIPYTYTKHIAYDLPEEIEKISSTFKEIYQQSQVAEAYNLNHIAGIGYRKSLEFLIKDFLITINKQDSDKISKMPLGQAIQLINNPKLSVLSKAATWIGNDETHYIRKFEDKDISDMKKYIRALAHNLSSEFIAYEAQSFIRENW